VQRWECVPDAREDAARRAPQRALPARPRWPAGRKAAGLGKRERAASPAAAGGAEASGMEARRGEIRAAELDAQHNSPARRNATGTPNQP
jgi:hypothetical protein